MIEGEAEAGSIVELFNGNVSLGTTTADAAGKFLIEFTTPTLSDNYSLTVKATDAAGNISESDALTMTVDITAPAQPTITTTTSLTNSATPTIEGQQGWQYLDFI